MAIGHHGDFHTVFCIMAIGHIDGIGQCRSAKRGPDSTDINDVVGHAKPGAASCGEIQLFFMALAIIKRQQSREVLLCGNAVGQRHRIQSARADHNRFHSFVLVLTG